MKKKGSMYEIMAPAGSYESLTAAINAGADSVYFGIGKLNMRARSSGNFTVGDLLQIMTQCHDNGVKGYLALNSVMYDEDLLTLYHIVELAKAVGVDAIIAADVSAMEYAARSGREVHLSTQLNIANMAALKHYARYADVVVLARELNLEQVRVIADAIGREQIRGPKGELVRIEMFCHGALCMAVSGKCYLSLHEMNESANRGACMQLCRRGYAVKDRESGIELAVENEYIMSPKDLKTIHFMNKLIDAGVRVFKIEGRARSPEYVHVVTSCYREAIAACSDGTFGEERIAGWDSRLSSVFNRGFWDGYYLGQRLGEWSSKYGSQAAKRKVYVAKGINYYGGIGVAEFIMETGRLHEGDEVLITGPTTGTLFATVGELRVNLETVPVAKKGERFSFPLADRIRPSDKLYKLVADEDKTGSPVE